MVYSKIKRILLILLCIIALFFPFFCVAGLCAEIENVDITNVSNLQVSENSNFFITGGNLGYFELEEGYIYHINFTSDSVVTSRKLAVSSSMPAVNVTYDYLGILLRNNTYDYISNNSSYFYFSYSPYNASMVTVTRERINSMNGAVGDLVDNVGPSAIWNIFDTGINYIYIVVLVAFGIFIITLVIRKITKGKEGF